MKVIIFGATGYLGSHVAEQLVLAGHNIHCVVRSGSNSTFLQGLQAANSQSISITEVDFHKPEKFQAQIGADVTVINCLAETRMHLSDDERRKVEVELTGRVFSAAQQAGAKRFIQLSTVMAYGFERPKTAIDESFPCKPKYSYSRIAVEREQNLLALQAKGAMELIILRPSNTLGKRDSSALPAIMGSLEKGNFPVVGGGDWKISCMDARDVGRAMVHLLDVPVQQPEIYLVKAFDITWLDIKTALDKKLGKASKIMNVPKGMAVFIGWIMEIITPFGKAPALTRFSASVVSADTLFDDSKIRRSGFEPRYDLEATLNDALD
jgi:nucleoside-diphosphate-sugar epimerase